MSTAQVVGCSLFLFLLLAYLLRLRNFRTHSVALRGLGFCTVERIFPFEAARAGAGIGADVLRRQGWKDENRLPGLWKTPVPLISGNLGLCKLEHTFSFDAVWTEVEAGTL